MTKRKPMTWGERCLRHMENLYDDHRRVTGEDVRNWLRKRRAPKPSHPNAYGALIRLAMSRGILNPTESFKSMRSPTSHGRITRVYTVRRPKVRAA